MEDKELEMACWNPTTCIPTTSWSVIPPKNNASFHRMKQGLIVDKAPLPSIKWYMESTLWILSSDTDILCQINQLFTNNEAAMQWNIEFWNISLFVYCC